MNSETITEEELTTAMRALDALVGKLSTQEEIGITPADLRGYEQIWKTDLMRAIMAMGDMASIIRQTGQGLNMC